MKQITETYYKIIGTHKRKFAIYECPICNKEFERRADNKSSKCALCKNKELGKNNSFIKNKRIHNIWAGLKARTTNKNHRDWNKYGASGVFVCEEWKDYKVFEKWALENGYKDNLSIDRKNTYDGYYPDNCRWTDCLTQSANTRLIHKTNKTGFRGVSVYNNKFRAGIQLNKKRIELGCFKCRIQAAYAYDEFVIKNNLENPTNIITKSNTK